MEQGLKRYWIILGLSLISLVACFKQYKGRINIDGSSSVYPITEAVAEEYRNGHSDIRVTVGVSGTGGDIIIGALQAEADLKNLHLGKQTLAMPPVLLKNRK